MTKAYFQFHITGCPSMTAVTYPEHEIADPQGPISTWVKTAKDKVAFVVKPAKPAPPAQIGATASSVQVAEQASSLQVA